MAKLRTSSGPPTGRNDMLVALAVNSSQVFRGLDWIGILPLEIRMKSPGYQQILAEGEAKGLAKGALDGQRNTLARLIRARLGPRGTATLVARIRSASESTLNRATDLIGSTKEEAVLLAGLKKLLPRAKRKA